MHRHIGWLVSDDRLSYKVATPADDAAEAKLKKVLAMIMGEKEAHARGEHGEPSAFAFCPECKKAARREVTDSAVMAAGRMQRSERLANWILADPERWERLQRAAREAKD
jgi:hypothetical protein